MDLDKVTSIWQILPLTVGTRARHMLLGQGTETLKQWAHINVGCFQSSRKFVVFWFCFGFGFFNKGEKITFKKKKKKDS